MRKLIGFLVLFGWAGSVNAAYFSLAEVINGSDSFQTTVDGITMTVDSLSPDGLANTPDPWDGLDFGQYGIADQNSFDVSFSETVLLASLENPFTIGTVDYSINGNGVASAGNILSHGNFVGGPLLFRANERYTFLTESLGAAGTITGFYASPVPVPAAAWLFGSAMLGLIGVARRKKA